MNDTLSAAVTERITRGATNSQVVSGLTHTFYHYPARFSPLFAREAIGALSAPGDWVADTFIGGGTTAVEALAAGRRVLGVDLNSLAWFVSSVKTTTLTRRDKAEIRVWAQSLTDHAPHVPVEWLEAPRIRNLPIPLERFFSIGLELSAMLSRRQLAFARCALLRVGQWALDGRERGSFSTSMLAQVLPGRVDEMLDGMDALTDARSASGLESEGDASRVLLNRSAIGLDTDARAMPLLGKIRLAVCSPPYPGVHVLYHRWQERGRRETPAPYWVANQADGCGESHYTMGGRSQKGIRKYYTQITASFRSLRPFLRPDGLVVQLVAFPDVKAHLPRYLAAMVDAGFTELAFEGTTDGRIWRDVPNRKWYHRVRASSGSEASAEVVLAHRATS